MNINLSPPCPVEITPELLLKAKLSFVFREITDKITNLVYFEDNKDVIKNALESLLLKIDIQYDENSNWCDPDAIIEKFNYASSPYKKSDFFSSLESLLTSQHDGNCCARAYACDRCVVEEMLGFSTVTWNKSSGAKAMYYQEEVNKDVIIS